MELGINYCCGQCGKKNVKLWRISSRCFFSSDDLFCVSCACKKEDIQKTVAEYGTICFSDTDVCTDQLGDLVPAIPGSLGNFWGYTSVPEDKVEWWKNLPLHGKIK